MSDSKPVGSMPSDVSAQVGFFDRFAGRAALLASRAPFFAFCLALVAAWLAQGLITIVVTGTPGSFLSDKYQLEINTTTTIITFLMVALLQNSQTRGDQAVQQKLNAMADGLADLMERLSERYDDDQMRRDIQELRLAVGLENREGTTKHGRPHHAGTTGTGRAGAERALGPREIPEPRGATVAPDVPPG